LDKIKSESESHISPTTQSPVEINQARVSGKASFFVESNPQNLIDLAVYLGVEDEELRTIRAQMAQRTPGPEANTFMDKVIAAKIIDEKGEFKSHRTDDGEALVILALQGNRAAQELLDKKVSVLQQKDALRAEHIVDEARQMGKIGQQATTAKALPLHELVAVHATGFRPAHNDENIQIQSTFDGTDWSDPRNTVHFALNHQVASHMYGSWDQQPYVVVSPLEDVIEQNKKPDVLNTVDTFFEMSPGTPLNLSKEKTRIIEPDDLPPGKLIGYKDNHVIFKRGKYTVEDFHALRQGMDESERKAFNSDLSNTLTDAIRSVNYETHLERNSELQSLETDVIQKYIDIRYDEKNTQQVVGIFDRMQNGSIENAVESYIHDIGFDGRIGEDIRQRAVEKIYAGLFSYIKQKAVNRTISDMGYKVQQGGMWAWKDDWTVTNRTLQLGAELGVRVGAHSDFESSKIDSAYRGGLGRGEGLLNQLRDDKVDMPTYREKTEKILSKHLEGMSPETRRMLYLRGLI